MSPRTDYYINSTLSNKYTLVSIKYNTIYIALLIYKLAPSSVLAIA